MLSDSSDSKPHTYSLTNKSPEKQKSKKHVTFDLDLMKPGESVSKSFESALNEELSKMQKEMENFSSNENKNDMNIDVEVSEEMTKDDKKKAALRAMQAYFESNHIPLTGAWKATADKRVQRHID